MNIAAQLHSRWMPIPWVWDLMIKYLCPPILLGLITAEAISDYSNSGYLMPTIPPEPYPLWLQIVCIMVIFFIWLAFFGAYAAGPQQLTVRV